MAYRVPSDALKVLEATWCGVWTVSTPLQDVTWDWSATVFKKFVPDYSLLELTQMGSPQNFEPYCVGKGCPLGEPSPSERIKTCVCPFKKWSLTDYIDSLIGYYNE